MPRIALEQLGKTYPLEKGGKAVGLREVSLMVEPGELLAVVGPSGSGKTTLLRLIAGLEAPSVGRILFDGQEMTRIPPERRGVGMVFQRGALFPHLTAAGNLALGLRLQRRPEKEIATRVREVAGVLGIEGLLDRLPGALSSGERQRVALGRALTTRPAVLLLDEPLAALDAPLRAQLRREIARLRGREDLTLIHVTHDQDEALSLGDRVAVLRQGTLQQVGAPAELQARPSSAFVAGFIGSPPMNLFPGRLIREKGVAMWEAVEGQDEPVRFSMPSHVTAQLDAAGLLPVTLGLRAEDVRVAANVEPGRPTVFEARVESIEMAGGKLMAVLKRGTWTFLADAGVAGQGDLRSGRTRTVVLRLDQACWFDGTSGRRLWP